jgi:hypothetical protein
MNLIAGDDLSLGKKLGYFALVLAPTLFLTLYTVKKSRPLSEFLDAMSNERLPLSAKLASFARVWRSSRPRPSEPMRVPASMRRRHGRTQPEAPARRL